MVYNLFSRAVDFFSLSNIHTVQFEEVQTIFDGARHVDIEYHPPEDLGHQSLVRIPHQQHGGVELVDVVGVGLVGLDADGFLRHVVDVASFKDCKI